MKDTKYNPLERCYQAGVLDKLDGMNMPPPEYHKNKSKLDAWLDGWQGNPNTYAGDLL